MNQPVLETETSSTEALFLKSIENYQEFIESTHIHYARAADIHPAVKEQTLNALEAIGKFLHVEKSYVCFKDDSHPDIQFFVWRRPQEENLPTKPLAQSTAHEDNRPTESAFTDASQAHSEYDQALLQNTGYSSTLNIPVFLDETIQGWLGFQGFSSQISISKGLVLLTWMFGLILMGGLENNAPEEPGYHDSSPFWKYLHQFDFSTFSNGHSNQLIDISLQIAENIGLSQDSMDSMLRGAFLHDVGKFSISDQIIEKHDGLTQEEIEAIRYHPSIAYDLLSQIPVLKNAVDIPHCHHESWDGSGYPRGLKGDEIPLEARIFSIVDVYDALCSNRPYRKAWEKHDAISYIIRNAGIQFDPQVVPIFLEVVGDSV